MGLVRKGTDEIYKADLVSSLSDSSVRATLPDFSKAPEFGRDETGFTAKIGHLNANKAELRYTDGTGTERTVGFSKVGANWEKIFLTKIRRLQSQPILVVVQRQCIFHLEQPN